ncbi:MAG: hypothetical protein IT290_03880 [Deltaproteobacteria bacterium]|nr:hypothetical protein [Deltaproteobacteria bacterium]
MELGELTEALAQLRASDVLDDVGDLSSLALSPFGVRLSKEILNLDSRAAVEDLIRPPALTTPSNTAHVSVHVSGGIDVQDWFRVVSNAELPASERELLSSLGSALFSHPLFPDLFARLNRK